MIDFFILFLGPVLELGSVKIDMVSGIYMYIYFDNRGVQDYVPTNRVFFFFLITVFLVSFDYFDLFVCQLSCFSKYCCLYTDYGAHLLYQDETGVYKNLLQEIAQRVGAPLPQYTTYRSGLGHLPVFTGTVELAGITFTGEPAKNKKQAEKNAAMAAWSSLKQCESKTFKYQ